MTKILIKRGQAEASLPTLDPGEPAITFESGGKLWIGTPSGNLEITGGGGGGTPGGSDTQVQFNDGGSFGGSASFVFNKTTGDVTINGDVTGSSFVTSGGSSSQFVKGDGSLDSTTYISSPAGSDTQVQFNNGGTLGGATAITYDNTNSDLIILGDANDSLLTTDFSANTVNIGTNGAVGSIASFGSSSVVFNESGNDRDFRIEGDTATNLIFIDAGLDAFQIGTTVAGQIADFRGSSIVFNENGADIDFRAEGDTAASLFVIDAGLDAVQIGTTTAGDIADFRPTAIVFNESGADRDFKIEGTSISDLFYLDAGNNSIGIGTSTPSRILEVRNDDNSNVAIQLTNRSSGTSAQIQYRLDVGTNEAFSIGAAASTHSAVFPEYASRGYMETNTVLAGFTMTAANPTSGTVDFRTRGRATSNIRLNIGLGLQVGSPTGGDKGAGTINTAGDIYKNNSAFTNPDYVFEKYFTGKVEKYIKNQGAKDYSMIPLVELKDYVKSNLHLPKRPSGALGIFERSDWVQEKLEELAIYIIELHDRIDKLEKGMV